MQFTSTCLVRAALLAASMAVLAAFAVPGRVGAKTMIYVAFPEHWHVCTELPVAWSVPLQELCKSYYDKKAEAMTGMAKILSEAALSDDLLVEDQAAQEIGSWESPLTTELNALYAACIDEAEGTTNVLPETLEKAFKKERDAITLAMAAYGNWAWSISVASNQYYLIGDAFYEFDEKTVSLHETGEKVKTTYQFFEKYRSAVAAWPDTDLRARLGEVAQMRYRMLTLEKSLEHIKGQYEKIVENMSIDSLKEDLGTDAMIATLGKLAEMGSDWEDLYRKVRPDTDTLGSALRDTYEKLSSSVKVTFESGTFGDMAGMGAPFDQSKPVKAVEDMYAWYKGLIK